MAAIMTTASVLPSLDEAFADVKGLGEVPRLAVEGFESCIVRFTTDIPQLTNWGTPLLLGPGTIHVAQQGQAA